MPALIPTSYTATVTWLGILADRSAGLASAACSEIEVGFAGLSGDAHAGLTRASDSRVVAQYPKGTEIRNTRQLSIMSQEELAVIAHGMGLADFSPEWAGASMVLAGIPDFSCLPPAARLQFETGATLTIDIQNRPCLLPAPVIEQAQPGKGAAFRKAALGRRGVTAWVERPGVIRLGDAVRLHIPDQPAWPHAQAARNSQS